MKTLFLVRHAKSSWKYPELLDRDRPLNPRGKRDAPEMGRRLDARKISPDLIKSSPAKRALETCKIICKKIGYPKKNIELNEGIYHAGVSELLQIIRNTDNSSASLMMFGHNPGLTWLTNELTGEYIENVPTCGITAIDFDLESWKEVPANEGDLLFFDYPKKPFALY